ncbi:similar to An04g07990 [Aspergillus luchuensis IFO 4308]|nr:similar to An04g07990 [Aspergillus luchuensis IFO 4308]
MILLLSCVCLAIAFQPLHPNVSSRDAKGLVKDGYLQDPRTATERALYGNTNSRSIERERLSFVTFPGAATRGSNCWQTQSLSHISRELIGYVYQEHEIVSSPPAADLANSVISASCCVGLGSLYSQASKTLLRATMEGTDSQAIKPAAISIVSSALGKLAPTTKLLNSVVSSSSLSGHATSASSQTARDPKASTALDMLATVAEANAHSTETPGKEAGKAATPSTTFHITSSTTTNDIGATSKTTSSPTQTATTENVGWGSMIESSFKTTIYCSFTERCGHPDISSPSLQSACEALVKDGCANPYVGSDFFGGVEFTANNKLASCMDSAPLTIEGCQEGLRRAASYVDSQVALKGDRACGGFVNIANAKGDEAGAIIHNGAHGIIED